MWTLRALLSESLALVLAGQPGDDRPLWRDPWTYRRGLEAFTKLRSASHISLGLEREGRRISIDYRIR